MILYRMMVDQDEHYVVAIDMALAVEAFREHAYGDPDSVSFVSDEVYVAGEGGWREEDLIQKIARMEKAIRWALGEGQDDEGKRFDPPDMLGGKPAPYWWRKKLREMSGVDE